MSRWLCVLMLAMIGCVASIPGDPTLTADLAVETAIALVAVPDIAPDDEPKPGDTCPNCEGRGYVGDGNVRVPCQPCGGGGKVK
jgi:hypothetical protein